MGKSTSQVNTKIQSEKMQVSLPETKKIESMPPSMLVSATYDNISKSAVLKFYEPESKKLFYGKMK